MSFTATSTRPYQLIHPEQDKWYPARLHWCINVGAAVPRTNSCPLPFKQARASLSTGLVYLITTKLILGICSKLWDKEWRAKGGPCVLDYVWHRNVPRCCVAVA